MQESKIDISSNLNKIRKNKLYKNNQTLPKKKLILLILSLEYLMYRKRNQ